MRITKVMAMAETADGSRGTWKRRVSNANPATPNKDAITWNWPGLSPGGLARLLRTAAQWNQYLGRMGGRGVHGSWGWIMG